MEVAEGPLAVQVEASDPVSAGGGRVSSVTALRNRGAGVPPLALLSGHGALPRDASGRLVRHFVGPQVPGYVSSGAGGVTGTLIRGELGAEVDAAVAEFPADVPFRSTHRVAQKRPPWPAARRAAVGWDVCHFSSITGSIHTGRIYAGSSSGGVLSMVRLRLGGSEAPNEYVGVYEVHPQSSAVPFSRPGDSGSLVFTWNSDASSPAVAVGTVVGGSDSLDRTYVLPIVGMGRGVLTGTEFDHFFSMVE